MKKLDLTAVQSLSTSSHKLLLQIYLSLVPLQNSGRFFSPLVQLSIAYILRQALRNTVFKAKNTAEKNEGKT